MAKLYFRYGAMDCGKTVHLLTVAHNYEERGQKVCICKSEIDVKGGTKLSSRIGLERETDFVFSRDENLFNIIRNRYQSYSCVLVDEAQFLTPQQADQLMLVAIGLDIPVICYGLRLNFRQTDKGFEGATRLLQIAHNVEELKTICECGRKATQNSRFINDELILDGPDILIEDENCKVEYRSLCPKCFHQYAEEVKLKKK